MAAHQRARRRLPGSVCRPGGFRFDASFHGKECFTMEILIALFVIYSTVVAVRPAIVT
jgi:hypothetical protein